jgi:hypothetical protein
MDTVQYINGISDFCGGYGYALCPLYIMGDKVRGEVVLNYVIKHYAMKAYGRVEA